MSKNVYNRYIPGYNQYGFGSWLKKNASWLAPVGAVGATILTGGLAAPAAAGALGAGAAGGAAAAGGLGATLGTLGTAAGIGSAIGNPITQSYNQGEANDIQSKQMQQSQLNQYAQNRLSSMNDQMPQYGSIFSHGGMLNSYASGGGLSRGSDYGSKKKPYPSVSSVDFAGGNRSYPIPTKADAVDALRLAGLHGRSDVRAKVYAKYPSLKHPDGGSLTTPTNYQNAWFNIGDSQADLTAALANKYPNIPVKNIVNEFAGKKDFSNLNLGHYSDSLKNVYGDIYLTPDEVKQYAPKYYDYVDTLRQGDPISTKGQFDSATQPYFGYRSMLERRYKAGDPTPYKILSRANGGTLQDITEYPVGGTHEQNRFGGVMVGNGNSVEQGEVRYKDYIFSNRLNRRQ